MRRIVTRLRLTGLLLVLSVLGIVLGAALVDFGDYVWHWKSLPPLKAGEFGGLLLMITVVPGAVGLAMSAVGALLMLVRSVIRLRSPVRHAAVQFLSTFALGVLATECWKSPKWFGPRQELCAAVVILGVTVTTILAAYVAWVERTDRQTVSQMAMRILAGLISLSAVVVVFAWIRT